MLRTRDQAFSLALETGAPSRLGDAVVSEVMSSMEGGLQERDDQQQRCILRLSGMLAVTQAMASAVLRVNERDELLQEACRIIVDHGHFESAWVFQCDPQTQQCCLLSSLDAATGKAEANSGHATASDSCAMEMLAKQAVSERHSLRGPDTGVEPSSATLTETAVQQAVQAAAFPLCVGWRLFAVLVLTSRSPAAFDTQEMAWLDQVTADLALAMDHVEKRARMVHLAYHDPLTGLANAMLFADRVNQMVVSANPESDCIAVVLLELERFTEMNDTQGRESCDAMLRSAATLLGAALPARCTIAHINGNQFAVAGTSLGDDAATSLLENVLEALRGVSTTDDQAEAVSTRLGVALFPADGADAASLFKHAQSALREARLTQQPYAYYSSELTARVVERRQLEEQLRSAIAQEQFVLHYQPRVDLDSGAMVGAEALIRWQHPDLGLISPLKFITLAEETGMIVAIGDWAINEVCAQQAAWIAEGLPVIPVAVNLSSVQFARSNLLQTIRAALLSHALSPALLELELTESGVMINPETACETLGALRTLGCSLALDDFGTGYSSLAHLKRFPFDKVKIDRGFVINITSNREDAAIACAIIAMAHQMQLEVIAEGVENEAQLDYLRKRGCDQIQGHCFSPAIPAEAFANCLRERRQLAFAVTRQAQCDRRLVVEDSPEVRVCLDRILGRSGYQALDDGDARRNSAGTQPDPDGECSTSNEDGQRRKRVISAGRR